MHCIFRQGTGDFPGVEGMWAEEDREVRPKRKVRIGIHAALMPCQAAGSRGEDVHVN